LGSISGLSAHLEQLHSPYVHTWASSTGHTCSSFTEHDLIINDLTDLQVLECKTQATSFLLCTPQK